MDLGIKGKIALVSGGSKGMGRAIAEGLGAEGAKVVIAARGLEAIERAVETIRSAGGQASGVQADLHSASGIAAAVDHCQAAFGQSPDIAVANVQGTDQFTFDQAGVDDFTKGFEKLVLSSVQLAKLVLPGMRARGWGRFVTVGSFCSKQPHWHLPLAVDNVARAASMALNKTLSNDYARFGVTVNTLAPGFIDTDMARAWLANQAVASGGSPDAMKQQLAGMIPVGRQGTPEEFAAACLFLCSTGASFVNGQTILVDGGMLGSLY